MFSEMGWVPIVMSIKFNILGFKKRIANLENSCLVKMVYEWSKSISGPTYNNWMCKTTKLLESINAY